MWNKQINERKKKQIKCHGTDRENKIENVEKKMDLIIVRRHSYFRIL